MGKKTGKKTRENKRKQKEQDFDPWLDKQPHSLIIHNPGKSVGKNTQHLVSNFRNVMEPFTASAVKVQKTNRLKDFISIAATINVSHIFVFNKTEDKLNLRIMKVPRGPTLWFNITSYSLEKDIQSSLLRPHADQHLSKDAAMCLMSGFNDEKKQSKLAKTFIKNMFPTTNIPTLNLDNVRRVVIWEWNDETEEIDFRQFVISKTPVGVGKKVKKIFEASNAANKALPKLGNLEEIADFLEDNMVTDFFDKFSEICNCDFSNFFSKRSVSLALIPKVINQKPMKPASKLNKKPTKRKSATQPKFGKSD